MFIVVTIICALLTVGYAALMLVYRKGWLQQPTYSKPDGFVPSTKVSIVIPARNEQDNIGICIASILSQHYPSHLLEVIVVDDHSTDDTANVVSAYSAANVKCIDLAAHIRTNEGIVAFKKLALTTAIAQSIGELIITTDADCFSGPDWINNIVAIYEKEDPVMIVAPVDFTTNGSTVAVFQSLDFMSMQGITGAAHQLNIGNMSNGANLAFTRKAYDAVDGYKGIDHLASGDDYLLMMKLKDKFPTRISYIKSADAIVKTAPQPTWGSFLQQRIRWASKSGKYDDKKLTSVLLFVYLFNFSFLPLAITACFIPIYWLVVLFMLVLKTEVELFYLYPVAQFFGKRRQLWVFPFLQPLHIVYIILAGFMGFFGVYQWKGRKVK